MEIIGEECGVVAIYLKDAKRSNLEDVPRSLVGMLSTLQHRGQLSAGFCTYNPSNSNEGRRLNSHKGMGLVSEVFKFHHGDKRNEIYGACKGIAGIGHTRYSTSGSKDNHSIIDEIQPFLRAHPIAWKRFGLSFNGNIANYSDLIKSLPRDYDLETETDTEILLHLIAQDLSKLAREKKDNDSKKPDLFDVAKGVMNQLDGGYTIASLFGDGDLLVFRDPRGIRPLIWGENDEFYAVASESVALEQALGISNIQEVNPGSALLFNKEGYEMKQLFESDPAFCQFEIVYFLKAISSHSGKSVREIRKNLGLKLAEREPLKPFLDKDKWIVVPAPQTAIPAAEAYAPYLEIPLKLAIEKHDSLRGFINDLKNRGEIMRMGYMIHKEVEGKKVILIDDSIVRGETLEILIERLRNAGVEEVHARFTEPPINHPCFYGVDFPTREELVTFGCGEDIEEIERGVAEKIGADSVRFQRLDDLVDTIGVSKEQLCLACLTGKYPTEAGQRLSLVT